MPGPLDLSMARTMTVQGRKMGMLTAGEERFAYEIVIDTRDGTLVFGRSTFDDIDLKIWMPFQGDKAPAKAGRPPRRWTDRPGGF